MKNVGQAKPIQNAQHLRGIRALHLIRLGHRTLQDDGPGRGNDHDRNQQNDAGLD